jgi:hypothetical protein
VETDLVLHGVLIPAACALALSLVIARRHARCMGAVPLVAFTVSVAWLDPIAARPAFGSWTNAVLALGLMVASATVIESGAQGRWMRGIACIVIGLSGAILFAMPEWTDAASRLALAGSLAIVTALLLPAATRHGGFSFWCSQSVALAAVSALALSSGFAKLALPIGAVSAACGWVGIQALLGGSRHPILAGLPGAAAIVGVAGIGSATTFAFDTGSISPIACIAAALAPAGCRLGDLPAISGSRIASGTARVLGCGVIATAVIAACLAAGSRSRSDAYALTHATASDATGDPDTSGR